MGGGLLEIICASVIFAGLVLLGTREPGIALTALTIMSFMILVSEKSMSSGNKYHRTIKHLKNGKVDVYSVLDAFGVKCPARQHAIKKLLCAGIRGKGDETQDLTEARDAIDRAIELDGAYNEDGMRTKRADIVMDAGPDDE